MPLTTGQSLSFYEVLGPLGAGAMGEVYLARDTRLEREVAIKVLPEHFAEDDERLRRFEREAKSLASLNHPNVAQIFGVDEVDGTCFLVLELVPGETLQDRIARGALAVDDALEVCRQIAEGLEAAHEAGVIHRDLKPANVRITPDGKVKVLDFGLAKPTGPDTAANSTTDSVLATVEGRVLGTPTYMSPEQARGRPVDKRTDIWAFGCVLFECLTGQRAFQGDAFSDLVVAILEHEADLGRLPAATPPGVRELLRRCLEKDPRGRLRDVGEARVALERGSVAVDAPRAARPRRFLGVAGWIAAALLAITVLAGLFDRDAAAPASAEPAVLRTITYSGDDVSPSASPDGRFLAFRSGRDGRERIWIKQLDTGGEQALTDGPDTYPQFSPDGTSVLFLRSENDSLSAYRQPLVGGGARKLVEDVVEASWSPDGSHIAVLRVEGGSAESEMTLCTVDVRTGAERELLRSVDGLSGVRWSPRGDELSALDYGGLGVSLDTAALLLVPAQGGAPRRLPIKGPAISPHAWVGGGGRNIVYSQSRSSAGDLDDGVARVVLWNLDTDLRRTLFFTQSLYLPLGGNASAGGGAITVVDDGVLALDATTLRQQLWEQDVVDGRAVGPGRLLVAGEGRDRQPVYSPDGGRLRFSSNRSGGLDLWELADGQLSQLTVDAGQDWDPAFGSDGESLLWSAERAGAFEVWTANADGSNARQLSHDGIDAENPVVALGGEWIVYWSGNPAHPGIWRMRSNGQDAERIVEGDLMQAAVSPDGRWASYILSEEHKLRSRIHVVEIETKRVVPFEITVESGSLLGQTMLLGRSRWVKPGPLSEGMGLAFLGLDAEGRTGVYLQDFDPEEDTSATRRALAGFHDELITESFDVAPDGSRVTLSMLEIRRRLMLAEGVEGILAPRHAE